MTSSSVNFSDLELSFPCRLLTYLCTWLPTRIPNGFQYSIFSLAISLYPLKNNRAQPTREGEETSLQIHTTYFQLPLFQIQFSALLTFLLVEYNLLHVQQDSISWHCMEKNLKEAYCAARERLFAFLSSCAILKSKDYIWPRQVISGEAISNPTRLVNVIHITSKYSWKI